MRISCPAIEDNPDTFATPEELDALAAIFSGVAGSFGGFIVRPDDAAGA